MKKLLLVGICIAMIGMAACAGADSNIPAENPGANSAQDESSSTGSDGVTDIQPNEPENGDEGDSESQPIEEPVQEEEEPMEFEEEEVDPIPDAPGEGRYEITYSPGTTICPDLTFEFPPGDPSLVDLSMSEDLYTMMMSTNEGTIELNYAESVSSSGEVSASWEGVVNAGGVELLYTVVYDLFGLGELNGEIYNYNAQEDCETFRPFTGERVGP